MKKTPKNLKWLELLFINEIEGAIRHKIKAKWFPLQVPKRSAQALIKKGWIEEKIIDWNLVQISIHRLTDLGRFIYCTWCSENITDEEIEEFG